MLDERKRIYESINNVFFKKAMYQPTCVHDATRTRLIDPMSGIVSDSRIASRETSRISLNISTLTKLGRVAESNQRSFFFIPRPCCVHLERANGAILPKEVSLSTNIISVANTFQL